MKRSLHKSWVVVSSSDDRYVVDGNVYYEKSLAEEARYIVSSEVGVDIDQFEVMTLETFLYESGQIDYDTGNRILS